MSAIRKRKSGGIAALLLVAALTVACEETLTTLPEPAWGKWTTRNQRYENNYLVLAGDSVVFGQVGGSEHRAQIRGVRLDHHRKGVIYEMDCFAPLEGAEYQFTVIVSESEGGRLYLEHWPQATWWRR